MVRMSVGYYCRTEAAKGVTDNHTLKAYKAASKRFQTFCAQEAKVSLPVVKKQPERIIQAYTDALVGRGLSPATIHTYIAPVCKAFGVPMSHIKKPKRAAAAIKRSRDPERNKQGRAEASSPEFQHVVTLQRAIGIRRTELGHLKGRDLTYDECGCLCVLVERGKGGKRQLQRILPQHQETVRAAWYGIAPDQPILTAAELNNKIDLHHLRADLAKEAYAYYAATLTTPQDRKNMATDLILRFDVANPAGNRKAFRRTVKKALEKPIYRLRGDNRQRAKEQGLPVEYDRLALLCTSVYHLSHWRLDVTVTNYML